MKDAREGKAPFLGNWTAIYLLIVGVLMAIGVFLYLFTQHFE